MTEQQTTETVTEASEAKVTTYDNVGMLATSRCDRCGGQAYIEARLAEHKEPLLFCAHHGDQHMPKLVQVCVEIHDHRPFLQAAESGVRDAASAAN